MTSCRVSGWHLATGPFRLYVALLTGASSSSIAEGDRQIQQIQCIEWLNHAHTSITADNVGNIGDLIPLNLVEC